jgi:3-phenylpropionate/trans-cinnamate dioxygenase ferredoxin reductase subunit
MAHGLVIVGGSYAAVQSAASARQAGYQEPIRILSDDRHAPYQRPPLSKAFLTDAGDAPVALRADAFYAEQRIALELGVRVARIDRPDKQVVTEGGASLPYDKLVLATGARPRTLAVEGSALEGVCLLRSLDDARSIKRRLAEVQSVAVIGGGFIGLEVAASCAKLGKQVTVIEALPRLMSRALPAMLADWFAGKHRAHGADLRLGIGVAAFRGTGGSVRSVVLSDGAEIPAQLVIAGIGVVPNEELAREAGLSCANGVLVDALGRSNDPDIFALGDCSRHPSRYSDAPLRLESVQNAMDQARAAGATIAGKDTPYDTVPWFWSDQYDVKLQMSGLSAGHDAHAIRGSVEEGRFSVFYFRADRLIGVDSVNRPAEHLLTRKLVGRKALTAAQAADASYDLKAAAG